MSTQNTNQEKPKSDPVGLVISLIVLAVAGYAIYTFAQFL